MRLSLLTFLLVGLAPLAAAQDPSLDPTFGDVSLEEGFLPDPYSTDLTAGGAIQPGVQGCDYGSVTDAPDVDLYYATSGESPLYIYAVSGEDTTILVNLPDGSWVCDDDSYGDGDPLVQIPAAADGLYDIWVGTYGDEPAPATLFISEIDPRQ